MLHSHYTPYLTILILTKIKHFIYYYGWVVVFYPLKRVLRLSLGHQVMNLAMLDQQMSSIHETKPWLMRIRSANWNSKIR